MMKKLLLILPMLLGFFFGATAQNVDPGLLTEGYPKYIHSVTERFYSTFDAGEILYVKDSAKAYQLIDRYNSRKSMLDVFTDGNYVEVDTSFFDFINGGTTSSTGGTASGSAVGAKVNFVAGIQDGTVTWTSDSSLTVAGLPFTLGGSHWIVYIMGVVEDTTIFIQNSPDDQNITHSGGVITIHDYTDALPSTASYSIGMTVPEFALDYDQDVYKTLEQAAIELKYTDPELWVDDEDADSGSVNLTSVDIMGAGYKYFSADLYLYAGTDDTLTLTVYGTNRTDADNTSLSGWKNLTTLLFGSSSLQVINATDTVIGIRSTSFPVDKILFRRVYGASASGSEDNACEIYGVRSN